MSGREIESSSLLPNTNVDDATWRQAARNVAGGLVFHHPKTEVRDLANDPVFADDFLELLDAVGYLETQLAEAKALNARLKGGQP